MLCSCRNRKNNKCNYLEKRPYVGWRMSQSKWYIIDQLLNPNFQYSLVSLAVAGTKIAECFCTQNWPPAWCCIAFLLFMFFSAAPFIPLLFEYVCLYLIKYSLMPSQFSRLFYTWFINEWGLSSLSEIFFELCKFETHLVFLTAV